MGLIAIIPPFIAYIYGTIVFTIWSCRGAKETRARLPGAMLLSFVTMLLSYIIQFIYLCTVLGGVGYNAGYLI